MKFNKILILLIVAGVFLISGCTTTMFYSSNEMNAEVRYLGPVSRTVGPFLASRTLRKKMIDRARTLYGDQVDDVIDVSSHLQDWGFFWYYRVEGKAVDYVDFDTDY